MEIAADKYGGRENVPQTVRDKLMQDSHEKFKKLAPNKRAAYQNRVRIEVRKKRKENRDELDLVTSEQHLLNERRKEEDGGYDLKLSNFLFTASDLESLQLLTTMPEYSRTNLHKLREKASMRCPYASVNTNFKSAVRSHSLFQIRNCKTQIH